MTDLVRIHDRGHVRKIILNRPEKKNAVSLELAWGLIEAVRAASKEDNVLINAPHTIGEVCDKWNHPYSRKEAIFPISWIKENKFWPYVSRIDNAYGDRNFFCVCPDIEDYK